MKFLRDISDTSDYSICNIHPGDGLPGLNVDILIT